MQAELHEKQRAANVRAAFKVVKPINHAKVLIGWIGFLGWLVWWGIILSVINVIYTKELIDVIGEILDSNREDPVQACRALIDAANEHGGDDNVTVIVLAVSAPDAD